MNKETFMNLTIANVSQVYVGKDRHCRCGCGGDYVATSYMVNPRSEVNDKLVEKRLKRGKRLIESGAETDFKSTYVNISTGDNRALTIYFDELK
jgi:hypothetical protein